MADLIFDSFSLFSFIKIWLVRIIFGILIIYAGIHFSENPYFISIAILIFLIIGIGIGNDRILIYEDRFVHKSNSGIQIFQKNVEIRLSEIVNIDCEGYLTATVDTISNKNIWNKLYIELRSGDLKTIRTYVYISDVRKAVKIIKSRIGGR